ncbi:MAG TPA: PilZ domain-containing protein [Myxococcaceae bacterium]|nr:PilZ domain-containing protein [Myxococcaceae bacterium]
MKAPVGGVSLPVSLKYRKFSSSLFHVDQLSLDVPSLSFRRPNHRADPEPASTDETTFSTGRRRTRRVPCNTPAQLDAPERSVIGVCNDISLGGMFFLGPVLPVGEQVGLTMDFNSIGRVRITGEVLAHRHHPNGTGMAIRFARLAQNDLLTITRFVAERAS